MPIEIKISKVLEPIKMVMMDTAIKTASIIARGRTTVSCKSGCSHCCNRYARISTAEALVIYEYLKSKKLWLQVKGRSRDQFETIKHAEPLSWFKLGIKCPILDPNTNKCLAYMVRPPVCTIHFVTSSPEICNPWSFEQGKIENHDLIDLYVKFRDRLSHLLEGHGVLSLDLPIPMALLFSERISIQSGLSIQQALSLIYNEL
jgi:Fe-S-cluster containining protein